MKDPFDNSRAAELFSAAEARKDPKHATCVVVALLRATIAVEMANGNLSEERGGIFDQGIRLIVKGLAPELLIGPTGGYEGSPVHVACKALACDIVDLRKGDRGG